MDWYPRNVSAYREDTRHLTTLEHGAYTLLLDEYYETRKPLPDDDEALAAICKLTIADWRIIAPRIRAFFRSKKGWLHQKRAHAVLEEQDRRSKTRTEKARKAALVRHGKIKNLRATSTSQAGAEQDHAQSMLGSATGTRTDSPTGKRDSIKTREDGVDTAKVVPLVRP